MRILVVDDDTDFRLALQRPLASAGHVVLEAGNGRAAVTALGREPVDVVVSDLYMPERDGFELLSDVRRGWPDVRVIVVSGGTTWGVLDLLPAARELGAAAVLEKPLRSEYLLSTIRRICSRADHDDCGTACLHAPGQNGVARRDEQRAS